MLYQLYCTTLTLSNYDTYHVMVHYNMLYYITLYYGRERERERERERVRQLIEYQAYCEALQSYSQALGLKATYYYMYIIYHNILNII